MKKYLTLGLFLALAGCSKAPMAPQQAKSSGLSGRNGVGVWTDPETGCEYLTYYSKSITPRMKGNASGVQRGCR